MKKPTPHLLSFDLLYCLMPAASYSLLTYRLRPPIYCLLPPATCRFLVTTSHFLLPSTSAAAASNTTTTITNYFDYDYYDFLTNTTTTTTTTPAAAARTRTRGRLLHHRHLLLPDKICKGVSWTAHSQQQSCSHHRSQVATRLPGKTHPRDASCYIVQYNLTLHMLQRLEDTPSLHNWHLQGHAGHDLAQRFARKLEALPKKKIQTCSAFYLRFMPCGFTLKLTPSYGPAWRQRLGGDAACNANHDNTWTAT